ncbi:Beta-ketoacyl-ACP synthase [Sulfidibacter corallicola]|uniref:Beta-ketoacyl-ACP synthase n=1 Tax=Sulfidibacter corallicola TaxID=2818388 RepID=A0A8A4TJ86_SULCO|nr:beta-ketoacyl-ACP synthase [Sulfidibacter corallicola]QTD49547.1 beta-ketoacyl-ACP synthase [Sulfidibacter corallicola]
MRHYALTAMGMVNVLGDRLETIEPRLFAGDVSRLQEHPLRTTGERVLIGRVREELPGFPPRMQHYDCRNHRLILAATSQIAEEAEAVVRRFGADRVAVVMGSSTAGLDASEQAFFHWREHGALPAQFAYETQHEMGSVSKLVADLTGARGPAYTHSTACTSSAKVFASAASLLDMGICDAVITGGVDVLCSVPLNGFEALGSLTREHTLPMSRHRTGLIIGEGAAMFVLTRERRDGAVHLRGIGESCDAHHISAPHPDGLGAEAAMRGALADADLAPDEVHYLNLHGTGTPLNDAMEAKAVTRVFDGIPCSSTKPLVGHGLGVAGATELGFCWLALTRGRAGDYPLPPHVWDGQADEVLPTMNLVAAGGRLSRSGPVRFMSNSFAFGGNNCSVIIERS